MAATLTRPEIVSELRRILQRVTSNRIKADTIGENARIFDELGLSSLELLELRFELESTWNVVLEDADVMNLQIVSDVIDLIEVRAAGR
jgi:acyl carrier protein